MSPQAHAFVPFVGDAHKDEELHPLVDPGRQINNIFAFFLWRAPAPGSTQDHVPGASPDALHVFQYAPVGALALLQPVLGRGPGVVDDVLDVPADAFHGCGRIVIVVDRQPFLEQVAVVEVVEVSGQWLLLMVPLFAIAIEIATSLAFQKGKNISWISKSQSSAKTPTRLRKNGLVRLDTKFGSIIMTLMLRVKID